MAQYDILSTNRTARTGACLLARWMLITVFTLSVSLQIAGQSCLMCSHDNSSNEPTTQADPHAHHRVSLETDADSDVVDSTLTDCCAGASSCDLGLTVCAIASTEGTIPCNLNTADGPTAASSQMFSHVDAPLLRPPILA